MRLLSTRRENPNMRNRIGFMLLLVTVVIFAVMGLGPSGRTVNAEPYPTSGFVRYFNNGPNVSISVYWNDSAGSSSLRWADDVVSSGADLNWRSGGLAFDGLGTGSASATLSDAQKYKNYYFKLVIGENTSIIRAFPVDFDSSLGPRYQNDYAHGNFGPGTGMCAGCHVTHSALKEQLLRQATYYELCMLCHGNSSSQSKYDVERGMVYMGSGYGVAGWVDSLGGPVQLGTSGHNVDDRNSVDAAVYGSDPTKILTFTCVSCHSGHSKPDDNYRLLKKTIFPANDLWNPQDVNYKAFAIVRDKSVGEEVYMVSGNSEFCSACHLDYDKGSAYTSGGIYGTNISPGPGTARYRHPVTVGSRVYSVESKDFWPTVGDILPLQYNSEASAADKRTAVVCSTCHFAHGTTKAFNVTLPPDGATLTNQKMLRLDNYGVCQSCHKK